MNKENNHQMSLFGAPIASIRDVDGRVLKYASTLPSGTVCIKSVFNLITGDVSLAECTELVRCQTDDAAIRRLKAERLPYITPFGVFARRKGDDLLTLSGLIPIDVDHLTDHGEARRLRDVLFRDPWLNAVLCFVSPSGLGVKALVPYRLSGDREVDIKRCQESTLSAMEYVSCVYAPSAKDSRKGVDRIGRDLARACFLCHDADACFNDNNL